MTDVPRGELLTAVNAIRSGEIVGIPTETVYGLAADPYQPDAVAALFDLKGRPPDKPFAVLVASLEAAEAVADLTPQARALGEEHWPGPLTLVVRRSLEMPVWLGEPGRGTIGVRVPDHKVALALLEAAGPLVVTSANWSGDPPVLDHASAAAIFGEAVAIYLEGESGGGQSSTVIDATTEPAQLIRPGPVPWPEG